MSSLGAYSIVAHDTDVDGCQVLHICLGALYLKGAPRRGALSSRAWPQVESALRRSATCLSGAWRALDATHLYAEATTLQEPNLLAWAEDNADRFLTPAMPGYPLLWLRRLGAGAPPALWCYGDMPVTSMIAIVGSRCIEADVSRFAEDLGAEASRLGYAVVSGGAIGCDRAGVRRAVSALEILPHGDHLGEMSSLTVCPPGTPFTVANAMERNALIYAAAERAVIVHARYREGGTWTGAIEAHRRRRCPMVVRQDQDSPAHRALIGLGMIPLTLPADLSLALQHPGPQTSLL
ncbi:hypothetical protein BH11ARM1_BH11ARM1_00090 [soil metagenome]